MNYHTSITTDQPKTGSSYQNEPSRSQSFQTTPKELADRYRYIKKLGQGAQGSVYLAERISDNLPVAIKHLSIDSVQNWKSYELFHREAEVLRNLNIKGVAKFYEAPEYLDIAEPSAYIVQEYIDGQSIQKMLDSGYRFTLNRVLKLILKLLDILNNLHTHNPPIIHCDLKPANILMKPLPEGDFEPYLIDFGAVANPQIQTGGSTVAGTYGYMPPEQLMGRPVPASDIYSLAAMTAYLLSGVQPGDMQITDFHLIIDPHMENIPNGVTATLHQMLEPKIETRLTDYQTLRERFDLLLSGKLQTSEGPLKELNETNLLKVLKLGQRGNIDLWLSLSSQIPRPIPEVYKKIEPMEIDSKSIYPKIKRFYTKALLKSIGKISWIFIIQICSIFVVFTREFSPESVEIFLVGTIVPALFPMLMFFQYRALIKPFSVFQERKWEYLKDKETIFHVDVEKLLTEGLKCIATVIDINYVPAFQNEYEVYFIPVPDSNSLLDIGNDNNSPSNTFSMGQSSYSSNAYIHSYPRYRLRYKFNPPDDDNPDDLIHEIIIHHDMRDTIHPGDPLPILYYVNPHNNLDVMSTPFPYPFNDIASYGDLYYRRPQNNKPDDRLFEKD